jgi:hypothetical protein
MAATTQVHVFHGAGPTATDITSTEIRFRRDDTDAVNASAAVPIPTAGTNYSWRKHTKLRIVTDPANQIANLRFFSSGNSLGTGIVHQVLQTATYTQASSTDETTSIGGTDSTTYTSGSPLVVNSGVVMSVGSAPTYGTQDFLAQQMNVGTTASAGSSPARTFTLRYDES